MGEELIVSGNKFDVNPESLIQLAIQSNQPIETMRELLAMRKELKEEWAKEQFIISMAAFQKVCPVIKKDKNGGMTNSGIVAYKYAPMDSIIEQVSVLIADNGFSYSFRTENTEIGIKSFCVIEHIAGYKKENFIEIPFGNKTQIMSQPQVYMSSRTFAERYAFCDGFGITTGDEDNDAKEAKGIDHTPASGQKIPQGKSNMHPDKPKAPQTAKSTSIAKTTEPDKPALTPEQTLKENTYIMDHFREINPDAVQVWEQDNYLENKTPGELSAMIKQYVLKILAEVNQTSPDIIKEARDIFGYNKSGKDMTADELMRMWYDINGIPYDIPEPSHVEDITAGTGFVDTPVNPADFYQGELPEGEIFTPEEINGK